MDNIKIDFTKKSDKPKFGTLYVVSTPIGNEEDITQRALKVLKTCDLVVCEEAKIGAQLLRQYNLSKELDSLNEQNESEKYPEYIKMLEEGKNLALVSDCGTPVFADPGQQLVNAAIRRHIYVQVVPGVSSIMTALVRSGFSTAKFVYAGFLSREKEERFEELKELRAETRTVVLLEAPYRLMPVLEAAAKLMPDRRAYIGCNLTMHFETHHYGDFQHLYEKFAELGFKGEFVIVFEGNKYHQEKSHSPRREQHREFRSDSRRNFNDKPREFRSDSRRDFNDKPREFRSDSRRDFNDKPREFRSDSRRDFNDKPREFRSDSRRDFNDKPREFRSDSRRDFNDKPREFRSDSRRDFNDKPREFGGKKSEFGNKPKKFSSSGSKFSDKGEKREFSKDRKFNKDGKPGFKKNFGDKRRPPSRNR